MLPTRHALRLARRLHAAWAGRDPPPDPDGAWRAFESRAARAAALRRRVRLAADRGLTRAAARLADELAARLDDLARHAAHLRAAYDPPPPPPDLGHWAREVGQLEAEFGPVTVRWADRAVRVATDPVVLGGVGLGPFAIEFFWDRVAGEPAARCFDAVALDPHPAAGRDEVVHPHVQGTTLCPGAAAGPLDRALADGRLADAFLLVRAVLTAYNPASPYVPLGDWSGVPCGDCGRRIDPADTSTCDGCEADLCDGCVGSCAACSAARCGGCLAACDACRADCCPGCLEAAGGDRAVCPGCLATCPRCGGRVPKDELSETTHPCPARDRGEDDGDDIDEGRPARAG